MGIGYEDVQKANPRIIYMSISGFGQVACLMVTTQVFLDTLNAYFWQTGPYSKNRVYDPVIQAVSGLASVQVRVV